MHKSVATIDSPEFINLQPVDLNPLMSSCEIKVLYLGQNRNHTHVSKEVATEMSKTLRGAPIVGYYKEEKEDFRDHGHVMTLDEEGFHFECKTFPYGFVSPDAKVWFQKFEDFDDFGNSTVREYLMTTGYLWTGQFEECKCALAPARPQSMELDEDSLDGKWSKDSKSGIDFFIINDATFSKLCILGDDIEPCFEGASVTPPEVSKTFNLNNSFNQTLFTMMQDLKGIVKQGGTEMELEKTEVQEIKAQPGSEFTETQEKAPDVNTSFKKEDEDKKKDLEDPAKKEPEDKKPEDKKGEEDDEEKKKKKPATEHSAEDLEKIAALESQYSELQTKYSSLESQYNELVAFKNEIDNQKKDELINSFYMLSDEDKKDVIENKANYSYDDIEAKLSVICVRKKVNFDLEDNSKNDNTTGDKNPEVTFSLNETTEQNVPAWISALKSARNNNN